MPQHRYPPHREVGRLYTYEFVIQPEDEGLPFAAPFRVRLKLTRDLTPEGEPEILTLDHLPAPALAEQLRAHHEAELQAAISAERDRLAATWQRINTEARISDDEHLPPDHNGDPIGP